MRYGLAIIPSLLLLFPSAVGGYPGQPVTSILVPPVPEHPDALDADFNGIVDAFEVVIADTVTAGGGNDPVSVMVTLYVPPDAPHLSAFTSRGGLLEATFFYVTYGFSGIMPFDQVLNLVGDLGSDLVAIDQDHSGTASLNVAMPNIRLFPLRPFPGDTMSSIAILDSGINTSHDDLGDDGDNVSNDPGDWQDASGGWPDNTVKIVGWKDCASAAANPHDTHPHHHGTHVSGCASGWGDVNVLYTGGAPSAHLVGVRIDATDYWSSTDLTEGLDWVLQNKNTYQIDVANISSEWVSDWGFTNKIDQMVRNGIVVTVAAGNGYDDGVPIRYPARAPRALTVGAVGDNNQMSGFSSNGPTGSSKPDVVAPGGSKRMNNVVDGVKSTDLNDNYTDAWGTSFASPIVAGVAATVVEAYKRSNWWGRTEDRALQVKAAILMSATETNRAGDDPDGAGSKGPNTPTLDRGLKDLVEGHGKINADAAVETIMSSITLGCDYEKFLGTLGITGGGGSAGDGPGGRQAWAGHFVLTAGDTAKLILDSPAAGDFDLYVYQDCPDINGEPNLVDSCVDSTKGKQDTLVVPYGPPTQCLPCTCVRPGTTYYVVVKRVSGFGWFKLETSRALQGPVACLLLRQTTEGGQGFGWTFHAGGNGSIDIGGPGAGGAGTVGMVVQSGGMGPSNFAQAVSPEVDLDFSEAYTVRLYIQYQTLGDMDLLSFGHIRLRCSNPAAPVTYDPTGLGVTDIPIGPSMISVLPQNTWGLLEVGVAPDGTYTVILNSVPLGTCFPSGAIPILNTLSFGNRQEGGSYVGGRFDDVEVEGTSLPTVAVPDPVYKPGPRLALERTVPNPMRGSTEITLTLREPTKVTVDVVDISGRRVRSLATSRFPEGRARIRWDGTNQEGARLSAGVYFVVASGGGTKVVTKIVLLP